jgi:hypothetical protein
MTRADKYHVLLLKVFILTLASIAITARPTPATAQEDEGLCVIDRTGKRNGIWNTCYSVLGKPKPDEAILCDTGMFSGEGHCRPLWQDSWHYLIINQLGGSGVDSASLF